MERLKILKTYKIYIGGKFPRTESGRYYAPLNAKGEQLGNICLSSRKDVRNAVVAARKAFGDWSERADFNRSQILYRMAEMLEGRKTQFIEELIFQGSTTSNAKKEVELSIDRLVYYAGWCDKYKQIQSSVNPVSSSHFNFSVQEPMGVVGIVADEYSSLIGLISSVAPVIAGGNTCVVLASEKLPLCAITFAEVVNSSDVPGGVINIITGKGSELISPLTTHMDVNAIFNSNTDENVIKELEESAALNLKRVFSFKDDWNKEDAQNLYFITDFQELKTTWHPIENVGGASSSY